MDPLQRMNAKKHPLATPTKNEQKVVKQAKIQETVKPVKEEKTIQKTIAEAVNTDEALKEQKVEQIDQSKNRQSEELTSSLKVDAVTVGPQQQVKKQQDNPKTQIKQDKPQEAVPKSCSAQSSQANRSRPQIRQIEKRQAKDILSHPTKKKPFLQSPKPHSSSPSKIEKLQKKQIIVAEDLFTDTKVTAPQSSLKIEAQIQKQLQIGQKKAEPKQSKRHSVCIQIKESIQKGTGLLKSTYYRISGEDDHGSFAIDRKYDQFEALNNILHQRWPGCFLPALSKQSQGKKQWERERQIRAILSSYLLGLSYSSHIYYRQEVQLFLRSPDLNASEMFKEMPPLRTKDVISRFRSSFGELLEQPALPAFATRISAFLSALRKVIGNLGSLAMKALALSQAYEGYSQGLGKFGRIHKAYEQLSLCEYLEIGGQRSVVIRDTQNKLQRLQELTKHNPFWKLHSFLSNQVRDAEAFLQVIIASQLFLLRKQDLQRQIKELQGQIQGIMLGHKSLKVMTSRRPKEQVQSELEQRHKKLAEERDTMVEMFNILQILLANRSIDHFKTFKRDNYHSILKQWAQVTQTATPQLQAVWRFISEDNRSHLKP